MAKKEKQKVKGCKKCGRTKRRHERSGSPISLFVRNKMSATDYFKFTHQNLKKWM